MQSGFENLDVINSEALELIDNYYNENRSLIEKIPACHKKIYEKLTTFQILPAHKITLLNLANNCQRTFEYTNPAFSKLLNEIIKCNLNNLNKTSNTHRYSDFIFDFSMYLYIMGGRALYEVIQANLSLPAVSTIRKHFSRHFWYWTPSWTLSLSLTEKHTHSIIFLFSLV